MRTLLMALLLGVSFIASAQQVINSCDDYGKCTTIIITDGDVVIDAG